MNPGMCYEVLRLQSFKDARPVDIGQVSVILLAEVGFYYDHNTSRVYCFSCGYEYLQQFSTILHQIVHEPTCRRLELNKSIRDTTFGLTPGVTKRDKLTNGQQNIGHNVSNQDNVEDRLSSNNGTVNEHSNQIPLNNEQQQNGDTTQGLPNIDSLTQSPSTTASQATTSFPAETVAARESVSEHSTLNISSVSYPHFSTRQARIHTFAKWNPAHSHRPDDFADLGFYFTGNADCVRCFCCGVGLKFWRPTDDIAYQHARLRPTCAFSRLCKGQAYIDMVEQEIRAHQADSNLDHLDIPETSTLPSGSTSTGTTLPTANESLSNIPTAVNGQPGQAATTNGDTRSATSTNTHTRSTFATNGHISSPFTTNTHTHSAVTTDGHISSPFTTNTHTHSAVTTNGHISSPFTTNTHTHSAVTTDGHISSPFTTNTHTHSAVTTNGHISSPFTTNTHTHSAVTTNGHISSPFTTNTHTHSAVTTDGHISSPFTTNTHTHSAVTTDGHISSPFTTNTHTHSAVTTDGHISSPFTTNTHTHSAVTTNGHISSPFTPNTHTHSAVTTDGHISSPFTTNTHTHSAVTTNGHISSPFTTNTHTHSAVTTNGHISSPFTTNTHTHSAVTTDGQIIKTVSPNIHTNSCAITNGLTSPTVSTNGMVSPSATTHGRNPNLHRSHSPESIDWVSNGDSGITQAPCVNGGSTLQATNGFLADTHQATPPLVTKTPPSLREEELRAVEREHLLLAARTTCRVCQTTPVSSIFLPCGHVATCQDCADKVTRCVLCGKVIIGTANIYLS